MKLDIFSVYDSKAQAFLPPFFMPNVAMAKREFMNAANDPGHKFCVNGGDYTLYRIGMFEDGQAQITALGQLENLGLAFSYVNPNKE